MKRLFLSLFLCLVLSAPCWAGPEIFLGVTGASGLSCGASPYEQNTSTTETNTMLVGYNADQNVYNGLFKYTVSGATTLCRVGLYDSSNGGTPGNATVRVWTMTGDNLNANICTSNAVTISGTGWYYTDTSTLNCSLSTSTNYAITVDIGQTYNATNYFVIPVNHDVSLPWSSGYGNWYGSTKVNYGNSSTNNPAMKLYKMQ
jgi:hypothetical protein